MSNKRHQIFRLPYSILLRWHILGRMAHKVRINRDDVYVSPVVFMEIFEDTRKEIGNEIFTSRKYKVLREAWVASIFSVTLSLGTSASMGTGKVWWLRPNPEDVAPDFFAFNTKLIPGEEYMEGINARWEVFEWGKRSEYEFIEAVKRKVGRLHDNKMSVIGYATKENEVLDFKTLYEELKAQPPDVLEVWILAKINELGDTLTLTQVYPYAYTRPAPTNVPVYFKEPYAFISKFRGKGRRDGGVLSINDQMEITVVEPDPPYAPN